MDDIIRMSESVRHASLPKVVKDLMRNNPWHQLDPRSIWPAL
jgi:hypothetical protein